jgi:DNA-binding response OmpR family regulator
VKDMDMQSSTQRSRSKRLLLVEDHQATADLVKIILEEEGYKVECVPNATSALLALTPAPGSNGDGDGDGLPDLVLLDLTLPDVEETQELDRVLSSARNLPPVLIMSAGPVPYVTTISERIKAAGIIYKPFDIDALVECVGSSLREKSFS